MTVGPQRADDAAIVDEGVIVMVAVGALVVVAFVGYFGWSVVAGRREERRVREAAIAARGRILAVEELEIGHLSLQLELHVEGRAPRTIAHSYNAIPGREPRVGQWLRVSLHPEDGRVISFEGVEP